MVQDVFIAIDTNECEHVTMTNDENTSNAEGVESLSQFNLEATRGPAATEAPWPMMPALPECEHPNA